MSQSIIWDRLTMPRMASLKPHEQRRFIDLHRIREAVCERVKKSNFQQHLMDECFWTAAAPRLRHPLSSGWIARRGTARTPRSTVGERAAIAVAAESLQALLDGPADSEVCARVRAVANDITPGNSGLRALDISMITSGGERGIVFPPATEVPRLLEELIENQAGSDLPPSARAVCFLATFLNIHPLDDGNGRCGRALFSWLNARNDSGWDLYIPLRKIIEISHGGFEIRVREVELSGNWLPLVDYFISVYQWIDERMTTVRPTLNSEMIENETLSQMGGDWGGGMVFKAMRRHRSLGHVSPFLSNGEAGYALALHQMALSTGCEELEQKSKSAIRRAVELLDSFPLSSGLYTGVTGVGFAVCIMGADDEFQMLDDLDCIIGEGLLSGRNLKSDIVSGVSGILIYALERQWHGGGADVLAEGLNEALRATLLGGAGEYVPKLEDLGMAHGLAGLLAVTIAGVESRLLDEALLGPIGQAYDDLWSTVVQFGPTLCAPSKRSSTTRSRIAWCYGSLGTSISFLQSSSVVPKNRDRALELLKGALDQLSTNQHGIVDASVCHGWSGAALLLDYLSRHPYLESEDLSHQLCSAAKLMLAETENAGVRSDARFPFARGERLVESPGLLEGALGVACAAQAVEERRTPTWASMLGLTRPCGSEREQRMSLGPLTCGA
ncbi:hypothetical protein B9Y61_18910 [Stenotrophomonas maltophilia]|nr:hypothetical protein B9Y61_18910 [Stenotrophomonas maltophilia]